MPHNPVPVRAWPQSGLALVVTLLLTGLVLTIVVGVAAQSVWQARGGSVGERRAYQALLDAESGLNTLAVRLARYREEHEVPLGSAEAFSRWLEEFRQSPLGQPGTAELSFSAVRVEGGRGWFTASSTSRGPGAKKVVVQEYLTLRPWPLRVRAALTSGPAVQVGTDLRVGGESGTVLLTTVQPSPVTFEGPDTVQVTVSGTEGVQPGDYVTLPLGQAAGSPDSALFRVESVGRGSLGLRLLRPAALSSGTLLAGEMRLVVNALRAEVAETGVQGPLPVTHAADLFPGEAVSLGGQPAVVRAVDPAAGTVTLDWPQGPPASLPEGLALQRDVAAVRSGGAVEGPGAAALHLGGQPDCGPDGCRGANDALLRSDLTRQLLGLSDAELDAQVPLSSSGGLGQGEVRRIRAQDFAALFSGDAQGSGLLIVDGDVGATGPGTLSFSGLVYLRGRLSQPLSGRLRVQGALVVRGSPEDPQPAALPTQAQRLDLSYDVPQLRRALALPARSGFAAVPGTWRQR